MRVGLLPPVLDCSIVDRLATLPTENAMSDRYSFGALASAAAIGALVAGGLMFLFPAGARSPESPGTILPTVDVAQVDALARRIKTLEEEQVTAKTPTNRERVPVSAGDPETLNNLEKRLTRIERQLAILARQAKPTPAPKTSNNAGTGIQRSRGDDPIAMAKRIQDSRSKILDPQQSVKDKLRAWSELRGLGKDAWTDSVVMEMSRIGLTSTDASVRADVWRQADANAKSPLLVPSLLKALSSDGDEKVREEAAETLENYKDDLTVKRALEVAKQSDADEGVRRQAGRSLSGKRR